jgi:hypothetical protein
LFASPGGCGQRECCVSGGEVADSGEFPAGNDERGVVVEQLADVFARLALAVGAAFAADRAKSGGVAAAFRGEMAATPRQR